jgi:hypothetical protein
MIKLFLLKKYFRAFQLLSIIICVVVITLLNNVYKKTTYQRTLLSSSAIQNLYPFDKCFDPVWCHVKIPLKSHYGFDPPTDKLKWEEAKLSAASSEQVMVKIILLFIHSFIHSFIHFMLLLN